MLTLENTHIKYVQLRASSSNRNLSPLILFRSVLGASLCTVETKTVRITGYSAQGYPIITNSHNRSKIWSIQAYLFEDEASLLDEMLIEQANNTGDLIFLDRYNSISLLETEHGNRSIHELNHRGTSKYFIRVYVLIEETVPRRKTNYGYLTQLTVHELMP